ncbi:Uncharacterised protein [Vibrio cholerae]|nr:Uncharacterised protein [Vibrio cholerae]CSD19882.1 Uncharacterised protein [Vibrio cholerae]
MVFRQHRFGTRSIVFCFSDVFFIQHTLQHHITTVGRTLDGIDRVHG